MFEDIKKYKTHLIVGFLTGIPFWVGVGILIAGLG